MDFQRERKIEISNLTAVTSPRSFFSFPSPGNQPVSQVFFAPCPAREKWHASGAKVSAPRKAIYLGVHRATTYGNISVHRGGMHNAAHNWEFMFLAASRGRCCGGLVSSVPQETSAAGVPAMRRRIEWARAFTGPATDTLRAVIFESD